MEKEQWEVYQNELDRLSAKITSETTTIHSRLDVHRDNIVALSKALERAAVALKLVAVAIEEDVQDYD